MKEKIIFKAVDYVNRQLISVVEKRYLIIYKTNTWIKPQIGKILAFGTQRQAEKFVKTFGRWGGKSIQIWRAVGKNPSEIEYIYSGQNIEKFWDGDCPEMFKMKPPVGTIVVDEIKLLELIA